MDIAILGAGVAGASAALTLTQQGHRVRVYERRPAPATMGAGVVLWPNASFVLAELGLLPQVEALGGRLSRMYRSDQAGMSLGHVDIEPLAQLMGYPAYAILRHDLQALLLERLAARGIEVAYGCDAVQIEDGADGRATVRFANGLHICPDLVIGADGRKNSVARLYVVGDNAPVYQGFVNWVGVAESSWPLVDEVAVFDYWGQGERFGCVTVNRNKVYWAGAQVQAVAEEDGPVARELVEQLFQAWPSQVGRIIRSTPANGIRKIHVYDHDPLPVWHRDNVLLIGDAAHAPLPTSGQGACQALEDAWHLAAYLPSKCDDLAPALAAFTQARSAKTAGITNQGRVFARALFDTDAEVCRIRNERASEALGDMGALAAAWGAGLPLAALGGQGRG
ncbi:NAD(P)/FAD-dependent oxidoreductase [Massilia sp. BJB1822]|uniref:FAD-dependent oxidoreductase n=1 Tax=Massilia sp. BJB1822 TaxID=2744470 RepID=UPI00159376B1|nr:FAD-dependent oxidoreductase [Massilia sp. BJB1822]NVE01125.1 FAD-dependent monooxygenase [Massilia sp. BJB1822]